MPSADKNRRKLPLTCTAGCQKALKCQAARVGVISVDDGAFTFKTYRVLVIAGVSDDHAVIAAGRFYPLIGKTAKDLYFAGEFSHQWQTAGLAEYQVR